MIAAGMLSNDEASNPAYFRHQVLEYAAVSHAFGGQNKVRKPKIFRRKGTKLSINTKLVEVEAEWLFRAIVGIETMEQLDNIQERYDNAPDIRKRIRAHNKAAMEDLVQREIAEVGEGGPIQEKLQQYRRNIAIGFKMIRGDDKIETDDLPKHMQDDFDRMVTGRGDGERDFDIIVWIAQNSDTQAGGGAGLVLKEVNSRRQFMKDTVGDRWISPQDLDGALAAFGIEDRRTWQPDEGHIYFLAKPVPQRVMDSFIEKLAVNLGQQSGHFTNEEVAELLKMVQEQSAAGVGRGKKPQMVLPTELADTLDEMGGIQEEGWIDELTTRLVRLHKQWLLISPRSWARYNIQNISGDFDGALAAFPASINPRKYMGPAIKEPLAGPGEAGRAERGLPRGRPARRLRCRMVDQRGLRGGGQYRRRHGAGIAHASEYAEGLALLLALDHVPRELAPLCHVHGGEGQDPRGGEQAPWAGARRHHADGGLWRCASRHGRRDQGSPRSRRADREREHRATTAISRSPATISGAGGCGSSRGRKSTSSATCASAPTSGSRRKVSARRRRSQVSARGWARARRSGSPSGPPSSSSP